MSRAVLLLAIAALPAGAAHHAEEGLSHDVADSAFSIAVCGSLLLVDGAGSSTLRDLMGGYYPGRDVVALAFARACVPGDLRLTLFAVLEPAFDNANDGFSHTLVPPLWLGDHATEEGAVETFVARMSSEETYPRALHPILP